MKRRHAHSLFGLTALGAALVTGAQWWQLDAAERVNAAIAGSAITQSAVVSPEAAETQLTHAIALSQAGDYDNALKGYKLLIQGERADLKRIALYNLGGLHLRQALKRGADNTAESLPLIELAKQAYRDLLRDDPADWDARYNLERALWLAPESDETPADEATPPPPSERAVTTMQGERRDLP
jgi:mxaK protein